MSVAFQKGVKGLGGMPDDFELSDHRLRPMQVTELAG